MNTNTKKKTIKSIATSRRNTKNIALNSTRIRKNFWSKNSNTKKRKTKLAISNNAKMFMIALAKVKNFDKNFTQ
jgi:hypothetical protein